MSIDVVPDPDEPNLVDKVAVTADAAVRKTQATTHAAFDRLAEGIDRARSTASPALDELAIRSETLAADGLQALNAGSARLRDRAARLAGLAEARIRADPLGCVAVAAVIGMAVGAWLNRPTGVGPDGLR